MRSFAVGTGLLLTSLLIASACSDDSSSGGSTTGVGASGRSGAAGDAGDPGDAANAEAPDPGDSANAGASAGQDVAASAPELDVALARANFGQDHNYPEAPTASSEALVALGKALFSDESLSPEGDTSCATCHDLQRYGQDGQATHGSRNAPTVLNAFRQYAQFWDARATTVEQQASMGNPIGHASEGAEAVLRAIEANPSYVEQFGELFETEEPAEAVTLTNFGIAVGAFERALVTRSRFDEFLDGDLDALTEAEKGGLATFVEVGCVACHNGRTVGGGQPKKLGESVPYQGEGYSVTDEGIGAQKDDPAFDNWFKVPMLLNIAQTAPYLHDGSVASLDLMVRRMGRHQKDVELTDEQVAAIVTFLNALTGELQIPG